MGWKRREIWPWRKWRLKMGFWNFAKRWEEGKAGTESASHHLQNIKLLKLFNHKNYLKTDLFCIQNWKEKRPSKWRFDTDPEKYNIVLLLKSSMELPLKKLNVNCMVNCMVRLSWIINSKSSCFCMFIMGYWNLNGTI